MLGEIDSHAILAVSDLTRAHQFYVDVLGLELVRGDAHVLTLRTGTSQVVIYVSEFAGTNRANALVWGVGDRIATIVAALEAKGVVFEHYEGMERDGDIHVAGDWRGAWFKDPDGNILHLTNI
ncbi:VOC family protein [Devosia aquimaris]|uniref:VOC family protein n=1 Tax=Devosia aquimaris TaxID=2866214 RepID=UPI001CD18872|nr:VOC family protein [Devosia sp. CJK-A8-3]